jgi:hypothetical protein
METTENVIMYPTYRNGPHPTIYFGDPTVIFRNVGAISAALCIINRLRQRKAYVKMRHTSLLVCPVQSTASTRHRTASLNKQQDRVSHCTELTALCDTCHTNSHDSTVKGKSLPETYSTPHPTGNISDSDLSWPCGKVSGGCDTHLREFSRANCLSFVNFQKYRWQTEGIVAV